MARTPKLNDLHYILLATAANRIGGNLLPPSATIKQERASIMKAITTLIRRSLAEEVATKSAKNVWREEDGQRFSAVITDAGRAALGVTDKADAPDTSEAGANNNPAPAEVTPAALRPDTKQAQLLELLQCEGGASIAQLAPLLSWLPHTTRAALTGLRKKKGYTIATEKRDGVTYYSLAA